MSRTANIRKRAAGPDATKGELTRGRILAATAKVLSRKGFAGTRLSDIAAEAKMQAPAIYYYFESREDLIVEVIRYGSAETRKLLEAILQNLPPECGPMDRILIAVEAHLRFALEISDFATASARNAGQLPEELKARPMEEQIKYGSLWRRLVKDAVAAGECPSDIDSAHAVMLTLGALNYAPEWFDPQRSSVDRIVVSAQTIVRKGLAGPSLDLSRPLPGIGDPRAWLAARDVYV